MATRRIRDPRLGLTGAVMAERRDGTLLIRSPYPLGPYPRHLTERLDHWAAVAPDRIYLAGRDQGGPWRKLTYAAVRDRVRRLGAALLARGLSAARPLVILSGNDLEHALLGIAALYVGIPYAPVSPAYATLSADFAKLRHIITLLTPGLVFLDDGLRFARALERAIPPELEVAVTRNPPSSRRVTTFADLAATSAGAAVDAAHREIGPNDIAKFLFTSGSTGMPKAVINTQRMLCANAEMITSHFAFFREEPPVILDWAPWSHTAGGNHNFNLVLYNGGAFYIDDGKPLPGAIEATVRNLREVAPNWYFNVPRGYDALLPYLHDDRALRENFFRRLRLLWYAGAGMAQHVWDGLDAVAEATYGERILILSGLGSTETAPFALGADATMSGAGLVGLPARGVEMKLVPTGGKLEARLKGPHITPGYWRQAELTAAAFDEEGYYRLGDALAFVDPGDVAKGFRFDGRIAEDFKLATGTWVSVGPLRAAFIDRFAPYVKDVAIAGLDRDVIGALAFPDFDACRRLGPDLPADASAERILAHPAVRAELAARLRDLAAHNTGSSMHIARALFLAEPPSIDLGEMTDKGSINQRAVLQHRAALVDRLYAEPLAADVICA
jgi:feruloyl-CoA synthase